MRVRRPGKTRGGSHDQRPQIPQEPVEILPCRTEERQPLTRLRGIPRTKYPDNGLHLFSDAAPVYAGAPAGTGASPGPCGGISPWMIRRISAPSTTSFSRSVFATR